MDDILKPDVSDTKNDGRWVRITWDLQNDSQRKDFENLVKSLNSNGTSKDVKSRLNKLGNLIQGKKIQIVQK